MADQDGCPACGQPAEIPENRILGPGIHGAGGFIEDNDLGKAVRTPITQIGIKLVQALNEMLKRVQHDKKKYVIPNLFRNLESANDKELIAFVLVFLDKETLILYISIEL